MNRILKKSLAIAFSILFFVIFATPVVHAAGTKGYALLAPIPTVSSDIGTPSLPEYLKSLVKLFVGLAIVFAVFMIVYGGVKYTVAGTPNAKGGAKKYITEAVLGLLIAIFSYILLQTINPALLNVGLNLEDVQFDPYSDIVANNKAPKPVNTICVILGDNCNVSCETKADAVECKAVEDSDRASGYPDCSITSTTKPCISHTCDSTGSNKMPKGCYSGNAKCQPMTTGLCSVNNLKPYFGGDEDKATKASIICGGESGGDPLSASTSDVCRGDGVSFSRGLFQINLTVNDIDGLPCAYTHSNGAFTARNYACSTKNSDTLAKCVAAAENQEKNIREMLKQSNNGSSWSKWGAASGCGL